MAASKKIVLTDRYLKAIKPAPAGQRVMVWDAMQPHLGVRISDRGHCSFVVVKRRTGDGKPRFAGNGNAKRGFLSSVVINSSLSIAWTIRLRVP